ncbi:MAG: hypothetical protein R2753_14865 [Chitinophagales bacterium]
MKKYLLNLILLLPIILMGQTSKVYFDYSGNTFEGNMPLPAEEKFQISGKVSAEVDLVRVEVFKDENSRKGSIYSSTWKRGQDALAENFTVQMYNKLRGSAEYDFHITYYRGVTDQEYVYTKNQIEEQLRIYLLNSIEYSTKKWSWNKTTGLIIGDLNNIIKDGLVNFTNSRGNEFSALSDNVKNSIEGKEEVRFSKDEKEFVGTDSFTNQQLDNIVAQIMNEVDQYIHNDLFYAFDRREILQYPTEHVKNTVAINVGYGGVWFDGGSKNFNYDHGPYLGVSIPFGKESFAKPFWNNLSISTGVFLTNFEDGDGNKVTGPIIQRPIYFGLGYKIVRFLKFQAGATLLETKMPGEEGAFDFGKISVRPYIGLSAEFNFWMDFAK